MEGRVCESRGAIIESTRATAFITKSLSILRYGAYRHKFSCRATVRPVFFGSLHVWRDPTSRDTAASRGVASRGVGHDIQNQIPPSRVSLLILGIAPKNNPFLPKLASQKKVKKKTGC